MSTSSEIVWEEPPPRRGGVSPDPIEVDFADKLREQPGRWAILQDCKTQHQASLLQRRVSNGAPGSAWYGSYEARVRRIHDEGAWRVYARYTDTAVE